MSSKQSDSRAEARQASRLAAVQALYQMEMSGSGAEDVAQEFVEHRFAELPSMPDEEFFTDILSGVPQHQVEIDRAIAGALSESGSWSGWIPSCAPSCAAPCSSWWRAAMCRPR